MAGEVVVFEGVEQPGVAQCGRRACLVTGPPVAVERNADQLDFGDCLAPRVYSIRLPRDDRGATGAPVGSTPGPTVDDHHPNICRARRQVGRNHTNSMASAMLSSTRLGRNGYRSTSSRVVEPVSTRMVSSPASMPATTSVSIRSPTM